LTHPQTVRGRRNSRDRYLSGRQVGEEEDQIARQSFTCPDLGGEEVRRYDQFPMPLEELFPSCFPVPLGRRFDTVPPQNIGDRAAGTFMSQIG
jgi:hypothetical protein